MSRKSNVNTKFKSFCKHSTLHGFYYFYKSSRWTVHLLWVSIIMSSLILCAFLSQMIWQKFIIDPTFTLVESTRYSISDIPFPAVTLCDTGIVYGPNTKNITEILSRRGYTGEQITTFYQSLIDIQHIGFSPEPYLLKMHSLMDDLGYPYHVLIDVIRKPCNILLIECIWRSKIYNCTDMFRKVYTYHGYCCQFDIPFFMSRIENVSFISGVESTEGLEVRFNGDYIAPDGKVSEANVLLYLFDHKDSITLLDGPINLASRTYYDVNLDVWAIDSSENVKALSMHNRKCLLSSDSGADFYQGCLTNAIIKRVVDYCRCLPFNYSATELQVINYSKCSWDGLFCVYSTLGNALSDLKAIIIESKCYQRCDYTQYDTKVKYIRETSRNREIDNSSRILVHFGDYTCMKYRREIIYTWDQMLANLGGIFGLCVGGSIISVIELLWFFLEVLYTMIVPAKKTPKKKTMQKEFAAKLSPPKLKNDFRNRKLAFVN